MRLTTLRQNRWLAGLLVVALALRALIPVGFMPSGDGKVALQICPDGFPTVLLHGATQQHHHESHHEGDHSSPTPGHDHKSWMQGHCPFGAAAGATVACLAVLLAVVDLPTTAPPPDTIAVAAELDFRFLLAQPRAPPAHLV